LELRALSATQSEMKKIETKHEGRTQTEHGKNRNVTNDETE